MNNVTIYCDGAFSSNRDQGGVGIVILDEDRKVLEYSNVYKRTSNNQMEIAAVIIALTFIKEPCKSITIYTDSKYVIGCATLGWQRKKNVKLWLVFDQQFQRISELCPNIQFKHVKGHNGNFWNDYCDSIAVKASQLI